MSQVNTELGLSSTALISLNDTAVRTLAGVSSGQISMSNLWGKSAAVETTLGFNNGDTLLVAGYYPYGQGSQGFNFYNTGVIEKNYFAQPFNQSGPTAYFSPAPTTGGGSNYEISITVSTNLGGGTLYFADSPIGIGTTAYVSLGTTRQLLLFGDSGGGTAYLYATGSVSIRRGGSTITRSWVNDFIVETFDP